MVEKKQYKVASHIDENPNRLGSSHRSALNVRVVARPSQVQRSSADYIPKIGKVREKLPDCVRLKVARSQFQYETGLCLIDSF